MDFNLFKLSNGQAEWNIHKKKVDGNHFCHKNQPLVRKHLLNYVQWPFQFTALSVFQLGTIGCIKKSLARIGSTYAYQANYFNLDIATTLLRSVFNIWMHTFYFHFLLFLPIVITVGFRGMIDDEWKVVKFSFRNRFHKFLLWKSNSITWRKICHFDVKLNCFSARGHLNSWNNSVTDFHSIYPLPNPICYHKKWP